MFNVFYRLWLKVLIGWKFLGLFNWAKMSIILNFFHIILHDYWLVSEFLRHNTFFICKIRSIMLTMFFKIQFTILLGHSFSWTQRANLISFQEKLDRGFLLLLFLLIRRLKSDHMACLKKLLDLGVNINTHDFAGTYTVFHMHVMPDITRSKIFATQHALSDIEAVS